MADSRPLCASCNERHWVTETCVTRFRMPPPPTVPPPAVRGIDTRPRVITHPGSPAPTTRELEDLLDQLIKAGAAPPVVTTPSGRQIGPWHPSEGLIQKDDKDAKTGLLSEERVKVSWSQAICSACYDLRYPGRNPTRVIGSGREQCCDCGMPTEAGIYMREDPMTVRYPRVVRPEAPRECNCGRTYGNHAVGCPLREAEPFA